jgi:hypothetical protein
MSNHGILLDVLAIVHPGPMFGFLILVSATLPSKKLVSPCHSDLARGLCGVMCFSLLLD